MCPFSPAPNGRTNGQSTCPFMPDALMEKPIGQRRPFGPIAIGLQTGSAFGGRAADPVFPQGHPAQTGTTAARPASFPEAYR